MEARRATAPDLVKVRQFTERAYREYVPVMGGLPLPMTEEYAPHIAGGEVWFVSRDGADVGLMVLEPAPDHLMIFSLAVLPEAQGLGVGRWMLGFAEERARALEVPELRLYTNALMTRNIRIYGEAGFRETGRHPNPRRPGWTYVDMVKAVTPPRIS